MPPKKRIEATVYVVDASSNFEKNLNILHKIFALKHFSQTKSAGSDLQQIILFNHPKLKSKHVVNGWQTYDFEVLKSVQPQIQEGAVSVRPHNFLYVLNGAVDALKSDDLPADYIRKIVFISDLSSNMDYDEKTDLKVDVIQEAMRIKKIWLYVIGINTKLYKIRNQKDISKLKHIRPLGKISAEQEQNYSVLSKLNENIVFVDEKHGYDVIFSHKVTPKLPFSWYVKINIGTDLEIPVHVYRTTRAYEIIKLLAASNTPGQSVVHNTKTWVDVNTHEIVPQEDIVKGYKFQDKFVEITAEELSNARFIKTQKCLTIFGFANAEEVPVNLFLMPDSINCIKADTRGPQSAADRRFALLANGLRVKNSVALAYRVYNNGNNRKFFCIFPCPEHKQEGHLLMGQFPFNHEFHEGFFRGKVEAEYKSETYDLMKEFLSKLNPVDEENNRELYPLPPSVQVSQSRLHKAHCLASNFLKVDPGQAPEVKMDPIIEDRVSKTVDALKELII